MGSVGVKTNWKHSLIMGSPWECLRLGFIPADTLILQSFKIYPKVINIRAVTYRGLLRLGICKQLGVEPWYPYLHLKNDIFISMSLTFFAVEHLQNISDSNCDRSVNL